MSDNWYYVDTRGDTQGPITEEALITLYVEESIHSKTYIWNGETVTEWMPITAVPPIYTKIKHRYIHQPRSSKAAHRRAPAPPPIAARRRDEEKTDSNTASESIERVRCQQPRPKPQQFDADELMVSIRRGNRLRDHRQSTAKGTKYIEPPRRLRDPTALGEGRCAEIQRVQRIRDSIRMSSSERPPKAEEELIRHEESLNGRAPNPTFYSVEVIEKLNRMRQKFGDVTVSSGNRNSQNIQNHHNRLDADAEAKPSRSDAMTRRIAEVKSKLDTLTDEESWVVTRVENVLKIRK